MSTYRDIFEAAVDGTVEDVKYFVEQQGVKVNCRDSGLFPLLIAAGSNNIEVAKYLISKGADINMTSSVTGLTPLQLAIENGNTEMVNLLSTKPSPIRSFIGTIKKYAVFSGRARRREFWIFFIGSFAVGLVLGFIPVIGTLASLALFIPYLAVGVRRLHDTNRSALTLLLALIPLVGTIILIVFLAQDGTPGENKFGPNPKPETSSTKASSVPAPAASGATFCPAYGKENPAGTKSCGGCGQPVK